MWVRASPPALRGPGALRRDRSVTSLAGVKLEGCVQQVSCVVMPARQRATILLDRPFTTISHVQGPDRRFGHPRSGTGPGSPGRVASKPSLQSSTSLRLARCTARSCGSSKLWPDEPQVGVFLPFLPIEQMDLSLPGAIRFNSRNVLDDLTFAVLLAECFALCNMASVICSGEPC